MNLLAKLHIIENCPNCESAWTEGWTNLQNQKYCVVCENKKGEVTGWVWGKVIDPFCWIGRHIVNRNFEAKYKESYDGSISTRPCKEEFEKQIQLLEQRETKKTEETEETEKTAEDDIVFDEVDGDIVL